MPSPEPLRRLAPVAAARRPDAIGDGARLEVRRDVGLLDTEPEECFDRFTRLAAELLDVPVSLVSLVDRDRQFFKSQWGLAGLWAVARQTPLSHSLCQHTVATGEPLIIEDAHREALVADNPAVRDLSLRAYAGVPLILGGGHAVGTFCVVDTQPRRWSERELGILMDLAAAVQAQLELRWNERQQQLHDRLTGLPNRALTVAYAEQLSTRAGDGEVLAVAIGINDLGAINEVYGTDHGDRVLKLVARRLERELEPTDVLGRLEGAVFVVLRRAAGTQRETVALGVRLREIVAAQPVRIRGDRLHIGVTPGIATADPDSTDREQSGAGGRLVTRAALAMRTAKSSGDCVSIAEPGRVASSALRLRVRGALRGAVDRGEITVAFQPIVELSSGQSCGFEALARWEHPVLGTVTPTEFIPVAETTGDIVLIGEHVLRTACHQVSRWRSESGQDLQITVNLSPVQLAVPNIAEVVAEILAASELRGPALALEITEGMFMSSGSVARRSLEEIRRLGVRIALDDFGTGYSALSYLKRFPVDVIKADRSFLEGLGADRRDLAVLRAILAIGDGMNIQVVAEGIETRRQRELLRLSGCPFGQGFLFAPPLPADQIEIGRRPLRLADVARAPQLTA